MKEILFSKEVIWFIIGLVLFLLEFIFPGLVLLFFGIGAWITSIVAYLFNLGINTQLLLFIVSSLLTLAALRKLLKKRYMDKIESKDEGLEDEFIGKIAIVINPISPEKNGKVEYKGSSWEAISDESITKGEKVKIIALKSIKLIVKSLK